MRNPTSRPTLGRYAKGNHVGQRIEFASEGAGGVGEAGNTAVKEIEDDGKSNALAA